MSDDTCVFLTNIISDEVKFFVKRSRESVLLVLGFLKEMIF